MTRYNDLQTPPMNIVTITPIERAANSHYSSIFGSTAHHKLLVSRPQSAHQRSNIHDFCIKKSTCAHLRLSRGKDRRKKLPPDPNSLFDLLRPTQLLLFLRHDTALLAAIIAGVRFANRFSLLARHRHVSLSGATALIITPRA
jgi:hypothetical protein